MPAAADDRAFADVELVAFDFDGVFTDNSVYVSQDGVESVRCWRSDGIGLSALRKAGIPTYIVSTERNPVVSIERTMFVGNDVNDLPALERVGLPVAVGDAYPELDGVVHYRTSRPGGYGAVREICDRILAARGMSARATEESEPSR